MAYDSPPTQTIGQTPSSRPTTVLWVEHPAAMTSAVPTTGSAAAEPGQGGEVVVTEAVHASRASPAAASASAVHRPSLVRTGSRQASSEPAASSHTRVVVTK